MERFQTMALAEHHLGANSINKLDKLWRQTAFRGTAATAKTVDQAGGEATIQQLPLVAWRPGACEEVGALYHRWAVAAEKCILKSCGPWCKEACRGREQCPSFPA